MRICVYWKAYLSTLIAHKLNMEAVHSITSIVISPSQTTVFNDQVPPWN